MEIAKEKEKKLNSEREQRKIFFQRKKKETLEKKLEMEDLEEELKELMNTGNESNSQESSVLFDNDSVSSQKSNSIEIFRKSFANKFRKTRKKSDFEESLDDSEKFPHFFYCKMCMVKIFYFNFSLIK